MKTFRDIIKKYFNRNKRIWFSDNVVYEMNGVVLYETNNAIFDFYGLMIDEVILYCKEQKCEIDKIVFIASYDIEVEDAPKMKMKMEADSKISIVKEDGLRVARICIGESVTIRKDHGYG